MRIPVWPVAAAAGVLAVAALALAAVHGGHVSGLAVSWIAAHPWAAAATFAVAGFADGLNPCAFTTLLLFIGAVLAAVSQAAGIADPRAQRRHVWLVSGAYMSGTFALYFGLGAGLLQLAWFRPFAGAHWITRLAGLVALLLGILMVREYFIPETRLRVAMPSGLHGLARRWTRQTTVGAALVGGVLIGLCTIPCGGGMYLATLGLLAAVPTQLTSLALLTVYNVAFVLPLVLVVLLASSRTALTALSRWHIRNRGQFKLGLGLMMAALGLIAVALA